VAQKVGVTERAAQRIVADLETDGYITTERIGRRNRYIVHSELPLRHPLEEHRSVGLLLKLLKERNPRQPRRINETLSRAEAPRSA
jgi:hypothetical protein